MFQKKCKIFAGYMILSVLVFFGSSEKVHAVNVGGEVVTTAIQSDGKMLIGGQFGSYNGDDAYTIARLNMDGTLDTTFNAGSGAEYGYHTVNAIAVQSDGKIVVGGSFGMFNGYTRSNIARLNADGTVDLSFNVGSGFDSDNVYSIAVQSDGKIVVGGQFYNYDGVSRNRIARLNTDGSLDTSFDPGTGVQSGSYGNILSLAVQSDGKILAGGWFDNYNGTTRYGIVRINTNGTIDTSFSSPISNESEWVRAIAVQSDGKIIIGGDFQSYYGFAREFVARLNADGSLDTSFNTLNNGTNDSVYSVQVQSDGKIIIGGGFTSVNGVSRNRLARLNANGSIDTSFDVGAGATSTIVTTVVRSDGKILIGGDFWSYNGMDTYYLGLVNADGSFDATFGEIVPAVAVVTTDSASAINKTAAVARGNITDIGDDNPTGLIEWGTSSGDYSHQCQTLGTIGVGVYSCTMTGLTPNTTYYYRAVAVNSAGTSYGAENSFVTDITEDPVGWVDRTDPMWWPGTWYAAIWTGTQWNKGTYETGLKADVGDNGLMDLQGSTFAGERPTKIRVTHSSTPTYFGLSYVGGGIDLAGDSNYISLTELDITYPDGVGSIGRLLFGGDGITKIEFYFPESDGGAPSSATNANNLSLSVSENLTLDCGSNIDLDNGTLLIAGSPQTNTTTCHVTTNDQDGYTLSLTNDRGSDNTLYHTTNNTTQDGQIQDKTPWDSTMPNAQAWSDTGLGFGILSSTATKSESWWGTANDCNDTNQLYAGIPQVDTSIMQHDTYSNTQTDTTICYKLDIPSTQISGEYTGSVTYTAVGRP